MWCLWVPLKLIRIVNSWNKKASRKVIYPLFLTLLLLLVEVVVLIVGVAVVLMLVLLFVGKAPKNFLNLSSNACPIVVITLLAKLFGH